MTRDEVIKEYETRFKPHSREFTNFEIVDFVNSFIIEVEINSTPNDSKLEKIYNELVDFLQCADEEQ